MILKILSKIKGRDIKLDQTIGSLYLIILLLDKAVSLVRGVIKSRSLMFVGYGSRIRQPSQLNVSKGVEIGRFCDIDCISKNGITIGQSSKIGSFSVLKVSGSLSDLGKEIIIGDNVGIGEFAHIGGAGGVCIGSNTIAGAYLSVHPENHNFMNTESLIREQGVTRKGIKIGENCWIGAKVTILDGSEVGDGSVIAAGAVVNGVFPGNVVIGGVPAKILKRTVQ
jgi:acetyltransferase-like isoleucine patch superfamily enzyme